MPPNPTIPDDASRLLLAFAECTEALDRWHAGDLRRGQAYAVLNRHGWDEATETDLTFTNRLRDEGLAMVRGTAAAGLVNYVESVP